MKTLREIIIFCLYCCEIWVYLHPTVCTAQRISSSRVDKLKVSSQVIPKASFQDSQTTILSDLHHPITAERQHKLLQRPKGNQWSAFFENYAKGQEENHVTARRRIGTKSQFNLTDSHSVQLHYQESLDYYRRSRQVQPMVHEYLNCIAETATLYEKIGRITSKASMRLVGQEITLKCRDCHYPGKDVKKLNLKSIEWRMIPYDEPRDIDVIFDTEKFVFNSETFDLTVNDLAVLDSGRYRCLINHETVRVYDIQVVENDETETVFENSVDGPTPLASVVDYEKNVQFFTQWDNWAGCNECGVRSTRRRVGICMVQKIDMDKQIEPVDYPALKLYGWGLPCRSVLLPLNFSKEFQENLARPSEVQIGHCEQPCPISPPMVFVTDDKGKITDQYEGAEGATYSMDSGLPILPPLVQRATVYEEEGSRMRMTCPKSSGKSVRWQNCSTKVTDKGLLCRTVDPFHAKKQSQGRIVITIVNALLIKHLILSDTAIYSCFYDGRLIATTKLLVSPPKNRNLKKIITGVGITAVVIFFIFLIIYIIKST